MIPSDEAIGIGQPSTYFLRNIITTVLDVTVTGWANVLTAKTLSKTSSETEIAGNLCREMKAEKKRRQLSTIRIEEEVGTHSSLNSPKPEGRIDVKIIYSFDEAEYFGMECKRINDETNDLAREYVNHGVTRFVTGSYSPNHSWGAMLGFVIDGKTGNCINRVKSQLSKHKQQTHMKSGWDIEKNFGIRQNLYRTQHHQPKQDNQITILHLFLSIN